MTLTEERRNEIAYLFLTHQVKEKGLGSLKPNEVQRSIANTAKKIDIPLDEAYVFARELVFSLIEEAFPKIIASGKFER